MALSGGAFRGRHLLPLGDKGGGGHNSVYVVGAAEYDKKPVPSGVTARGTGKVVPQCQRNVSASGGTD